MTDTKEIAMNSSSLTDPRGALSLEGRQALVTGAGRGFGEQIARDLAALGAVVGVLDISSEAAERVAAATGGIPIECDVSDFDAVQQGIGRMAEEAGPIDILVNNAGVASTLRFPDLTLEEWDRQLAVNLTSMFSTTKACVPGMVERGRGRIVNITSIAAKRGGGVIGTIAYAAAKAGVIGFTKALARELGPSGVTVNAIAPGVMRTEMTKVLDTDEELRARALSLVPLGHRGEIQDIASAVVFLVSDLAGYITGETVNVDGGVLME
jgi:NAD(P)-dependent dehydrogenase (short-subunit alcohol dehydrogenase family)